MEDNEKEYLMLRTEIENNLKRQEALFLIIFTVLSVVNTTNYNFWNYKILLLISALIFFLQLKILQARNTVYYLLTYLIVFLESEESSNFHWETRLYKFRKLKYVEEKTKNSKRILNFINKTIGKIASYMHNFVNLTLAGYLFFKIIFMIPMETRKIKVVLIIIIASVIFILNCIYALAICFDKSLKERYLKMWKQLKIEETKEEIRLRGKIYV